MKLILFVCTGNTCRSPMAEAWFNHAIQSEPTLCGRYKALSRGLYATGGAISGYAQAALSEAGAEPGYYLCHCPQNLDKADMELAAVVYGITASHAERIRFMFPEYADKVRPFPTDIADPYGGTPAMYRDCLTQIQRGIAEVLKTLSAEEENPQ